MSIVMEILLCRRICIATQGYTSSSTSHDAHVLLVECTDTTGTPALPACTLKQRVEVSRIQREPAACAEYKIILMPGFACIRPPAFDRQPLLWEGGHAGLWQRQHGFRGNRFGRPQI
jgi:hypothetical protein